MKTPHAPTASIDTQKKRLRELASLFLRLGFTSFGGPAVHIAMMEDEVVKRRGWLTSQQFLDMIAATNFIPGPNSTEMAIHIGYERAGFKGFIVAGVSFIVPAVLIVTVLAWAYVNYGKLPVADSFLYGIKPVVMAVVLQALWRLGRSAIKTKFLAVLAILSGALNLGGLSEIPTLFLAALIAILVSKISNSLQAPRRMHCWSVASILQAKQMVLTAPALILTSALSASVNLWQLFLVFLKVGSVLFGSGYVLLAFLRTDLVERLGWLTESQLLDAIAIGQITPGPVFTTATFIGYVLAGPSGALVATGGIFLPAFFFVAISAPLIPYLRRSSWASKALDGLNAASLALMAVVTMRIGGAAIYDVPTVLLFIFSASLLLFSKLNSTWLVLIGGLLGWVCHA